MQPLSGRVAVVAGATRGAGRGIATMLGEAGATVYCTGRSVRGRLASGPGRPETIEETAELVTACGGTGIWVRVDHSVEAEVEALFGRVRDEQGRLDVLVNDVWGGDVLTEWGRPFWELSTKRGLAMLRQAVDTHIITSRHGVPILLEGGQGLVVEVTDGDFLGYRGNLFYDLVKIGVIRLAYDMAFGTQGPGRDGPGRDTRLPPLGGGARPLRRDRGELEGGHRARPALRPIRITRVRGPGRGRPCC